MTDEQMPGESFWVPFGDVYDRALWPTEYQRVTVKRGKHQGKEGIIRAIDGGSCMVHIRTGDPAKWAEWDAETTRLLRHGRA